MDANIKKIPFSLEAEQSVLGAILVNPESISEIGSIIKPDDFYITEHKEMYLAMQSLFLLNKSIDPVTLSNMLVQNGVYDEENSRKNIKIIAQTVPYASNFTDYAQIVKDKALLRSLIEATDEISADAYAQAGDAKDIIDNAEQRIFSITQGSENRGFVHISESLVGAFGEIKMTPEERAEKAGPKTGFGGIDEKLVEMGKGNLILIGARPGKGKTSFAMNIAANVAKSSKKSVCVFSLEMSHTELASRLLSSEAMIDSYTLRSGKITKDEDWEKLSKAASSLSKCNIYIDDSSSTTVAAMKGKLRRVKDLGLVIVDYLQLMHADKHIDNRVLEVAEISRGLKLLAKDLAVPIIACAQLSRSPESRNDKKPILSDLRDSGAIEQDADVVMFLHREDKPDDDADKNTAFCVIAKNRHGSTGDVELRWLGQYTKYMSIAQNMEA